MRLIDRMITFSEVSGVLSREIESINTMFVGLITSADYSRNRYSVQPILNIDEKKRAIIVNCPMCFYKTKTFYIRAPYEVGDVVYVGCSKESIDESIYNAEIKNNRLSGVNHFREVDGVILGGIMVDTEEVLDDQHTNDFIIQNRTNKDLVVLKKDGGILMKTGTAVDIESPVANFSGDVNVSGKMTGGQVETKAGVNLDTHTHKYEKPAHSVGLASTTTGEG